MSALVLGLLACKLIDPGETPDTGATSTTTVPAGPAIETVTYDKQTNSSGRMKIVVDVPEGATSMQLTAIADNAYVLVEKLVGPDGETVVDGADWVGSPTSLTESFYMTSSTMAFNWPIRGEDEPLRPGEWSVWLTLGNSFGTPVPNRDCEVLVTLKSDPEPDDAVIGVQSVYADQVDDDPAVVEAVEAAVERWRRIWENKGVTLAEHYVSSKLDPDGQYFLSGSDDVQDISDRKEPGELQLIVGESILNDQQILGISAGIPGTIEATRQTYVLLSWLQHAGFDGEFDEEEIRIMGETMAHETGHYIGLFHPVEIGFDAWDALEDTDDCSDLRGCQDVLGNNLMYPYPVCNTSSCEPQGQLTDEQRVVIQQQVSAL
ncbi:MAG: hypothetical protein R3F59_11980 [Myxococcota bacterium]